MSAAPWRDAWDKAGPLPDTLGARYLIGRGVPLTLAVAAGVRWATSWYGRPAVVFPIVDQAGELVAATGRHTDQGDPKAHAGGPKSQGLFTTPGALGASALVIVEAPIDALALAACGVPAVALCGTSGPTWLPAAAALRPVLLALDNDQAGDAAAATLARTLSSYGACCERLRPGPGKDWAEALATLGRAGLEARLAELHLTTTPSAPLLEDVAPDDFGDLRDLLERGQLRGYGRLGLEGGGVVLNLEGYVATRLEDLAWPALAQGAALQLRRVRAALASIDMLAAEYFRIVNKSSLTNEDNPYPTR